jgi:hypothetical protein
MVSSQANRGTDLLEFPNPFLMKVLWVYCLTELHVKHNSTFVNDDSNYTSKEQQYTCYENSLVSVTLYPHVRLLSLLTSECRIGFRFGPVYFIFNLCCGTLGTAATTGLLYQPRMIGEGDCGEIGGMKSGRGNRSTRRKPASAPLRPPQTSHD